LFSRLRVIGLRIGARFLLAVEIEAAAALKGGRCREVETGADAILNLATSPALEGRSGLYFDGQKETRAGAQAYDAKAREQLRALSLDLVGQASAKSKEQHS